MTTDTIILNNYLIGRVEPYIYAFSTETVPNSLKIGDTYRPLEQRLNEWRHYFPNLVKQFSDIAKVNDENYFRDFAVHYYLEQEKKLLRLLPETFKNLPYYSKEFFENATVEDIKAALLDIKQSFDNQSGKYQFYSFDESRIPITQTYAPTEKYAPRPNQQATIDNFKKAVKAGRKNLLMYAVMRFGKSFTAMCCAAEMKAKLVIIVSAKADVKEEWKKTVESHQRFKGYFFCDSNFLLTDTTALSQKLRKGNVAVFLTLQDLMGTDIKEKHKDFFDNVKNYHDDALLIVDETHYGARASEYGKVLRNLTAKQLAKELSGTDVAEDFENNETLKSLQTKVRLHLSGTPYRILMGDEFAKEDIIAFYKFTDIVKDQENWDKQHLLDDNGKEWDNPYYGFPQMIRFAFNPNKSSMEKMNKLKEQGITYAFSELFRPESIAKDTSADKKHQKFIYEQEVIDLLEVIDGSKADDNVLGFLDLEQIKKGKMCRHLVCVLPYRASCDAMEKLITDHKCQFRNLNQYEIINIAGVENDKRFKDTLSVKSAIKECEANDQKTLTLTVNRMLTGSTVEEWDTMIYLKDTASPQEYDQAVFRLQNQYIKIFTDENRDVLKYNMKPQTLLVDFNPNRMFRLQEQKSQIYDVNTDKNGNSNLEKRIEGELRISPIIFLNKNKLQEVKPANVMDAVREYSADKSVMDEATDIPTDFSLLQNETLKNALESLSPIDAKQGIDIKPVVGDGDDIGIPTVGIENEMQGQISEDPHQNDSQEEIEENSLGKKLATYYAQILFFACLTDSDVKSLEDILKMIDANDDNRRIARHVGLCMEILRIIQEKSNPFILSMLDYKIQNLNSLMKDSDLQPAERVAAAMKKFGRLSSSEIVTPPQVAKEMVEVLPDSDINTQTKILDIASKQGEFTCALYEKFGDTLKNNIFAIPTSALAYEFTRKVYSLLEMPIENVFSDFTSYDLINETKKQIIMERLKAMNFDIIIGNPPYQEMDGGGAGTSAMPIYNIFVDLVKEICPKYIANIMPARWYAGGKGLDDFRASMLDDRRIRLITDFPNPKDCFPSLNISGGVCYFLWDKYYDGSCTLTNVINGERNSAVRELNDFQIFIRYNRALSIIRKVTAFNFTSLMTIVSTRNPFDLSSAVRGMDQKQNITDVTVYSSRGAGFLPVNSINSGNEWIDKHKVFMGKVLSGHIGETDEKGQVKVISTIQKAKPQEVATDSYLLIGNYDNMEETINLEKYLKTKFLRFLLLQSLVSMNISRGNFRFVPLQNFTPQSDIDWSKSVSEIDNQLYRKYQLSAEEIAFIEKMIKPM